MVTKINAFSAIGEAKNNWETSRNNALISNNHWSLPNGTHYSTDMIDAIRNVLMIMITITQIDIAIFGAVISEITCIFTVRMLLNEKSFTKNNNYNQIPTADNNEENIELV